MNWIGVGSGYGLSPIRRQAITCTNAHLLSIGPLGTNFSEIRIKIQSFSFTKMHLKMATNLFRPQCVNRLTLILTPKGVYLSHVYVKCINIWGSAALGAAVSVGFIGWGDCFPLSLWILHVHSEYLRKLISAPGARFACEIFVFFTSNHMWIAKLTLTGLVQPLDLSMDSVDWLLPRTDHKRVNCKHIVTCDPWWRYKHVWIISRWTMADNLLTTIFISVF